MTKAPPKFNASSSAVAIEVRGAGSPDVNGTYARTPLKSCRSEVFQKPGTRLAIIKRGEGRNWAIVDLGGRPTGSVDKGDYKPAASSLNWLDSSIGNSLLRWRPQALVLYEVDSQMSSTPLPPEVGWQAVEAILPAPCVTTCGFDITPASILVGRIPGSRLKQVAEASPTSNKVTASIYKPKRTASAPTLPPLGAQVSYGSSATHEAFTGQYGSVSFLPAVSSPSMKKDVPGEIMMLNFTVLLSRQSFHTEWGWIMSPDDLNSNGRRVIMDVEIGSPLDRWNAWQLVRGRPDLCVRSGDQILKSDGRWAHYDTELESSEGFEHFPDAPTEGFARPPGVGATTIYLELGRIVRRPSMPSPPRLEGWEVGHGLRVDFGAEMAGKWQQDVIAWALVLREDIPAGTLGAGSAGKVECNWHVYDGESGKVRPISQGLEVGSLIPDPSQRSLTVHLGTGIKTGRTYSACIAFLTADGWSSFSQLSRSIYLRKSAGPVNGILALTLPDEDVQVVQTVSLMRAVQRAEPARRNRVFFALPLNVRPCFTTPISSQCKVGNGAEFLSSIKLLTLPLVLRKGRPKGLKVSCPEDGGNVLVVDETGSQDENQHRALKLPGVNVEWRLMQGDFIVRINGLSGSLPMVEELTRDPPILALEVLRAAGGKIDEASQIFRLNVDYDEKVSKHVEEVRVHGLLGHTDAQLAMTLVSSDESLIDQSIAQATKRDIEIYRQLYSTAPDYEVTSQNLDEGLPPNPILQESKQRVLVLRRLRAVAEYKEDSSSAGAEQGMLVQACRVLSWALADPSCDPEFLIQKIEEFQQVGGGLIRSSTHAMVLKKRAHFQSHLWWWRQRLKQLRKSIKEATDDLLSCERSERKENRSQKPVLGRTMNIVEARNILRQKLSQVDDFAEELGFDLAESQAVYKRNTTGAKVVVTASGEVVLATKTFYPERTLELGEEQGWW
eukprot:TRINITY_DN88244_c0_g1_i1.p1 TRINITY_DN88244_c0_g1~~TRINITY_DN88244_c0_g1_i1.p1  ORF type:complete len:951 (+),score=134.36 TRINITY_DN88244_c0_g1_i1:56-2908(+)